jgi:hypothetical protein
MTTYETLSAEARPVGRDGYMEVARKRLVEDGRERDFVLVTRGIVQPDGTKRWTRFVTLPDDAELRDWLADALRRA